MYIKYDTKKSIDYASIKTGCVFKCGKAFFIKGDDGATNLETGQRVEPSAEDTKWNTCYIYPKASMSLY